MVNRRPTKAWLLAFSTAFVASAAVLLVPARVTTNSPYAAEAMQPVLTQQAKPAAPAIVLPPAVEDVLDSGVLIVISKASQRMYVFKDGALWRTSPVSTGKRGKATPAGVFPILQKKVFHRSNLYSNAPMPYMQRLTWSGIAIHAGRLPGYPASHGCIRLPSEFARSLYGLTKASRTTVVIANEPLKSEAHAQRFALNAPAPRLPNAPNLPEPSVLAQEGQPSSPVAIAAVPTSPVPIPDAPLGGRVQTIQLAAAGSPADADAHWNALLGSHPELGRFDKTVIPAQVGMRRVFRLRVSAPGAHAYCNALKSSGVDCFKVS